MYVCMYLCVHAHVCTRVHVLCMCNYVVVRVERESLSEILIKHFHFLFIYVTIYFFARNACAWLGLGPVPVRVWKSSSWILPQASTNICAACAAGQPVSNLRAPDIHVQITLFKVAKPTDMVNVRRKRSLDKEEDEASLSALTVRQLVTKCKDMGISVKAKRKAEIIQL